MTEDGYIGQSVLRREDPRLLRGEGLFVADLQLPGMVHAAVLRSSRAHARLRRVDVSRAQAHPGVLAALSGADLADLPKMPPNIPDRALRAETPYTLARDRVRFVGEPVAVVVADSAYLAEDALELIDVEYEDLPVVLDAEAALAPNAQLLHEDLDSNLAAIVTQVVGDPDRAFAEADLVIQHPFRFGRLSGQAMETRGVVATYARTKLGGSFTVWSSNQSPHSCRRTVAMMLGVPERSVRVIAPDVGGGFGVKGRVYPEDILVPYLARLLGRAVRWIGDRREDLLSSTQAREQIHSMELAVRRDGTILGVRDHYLVDIGAYSPYGLTVPLNTGLQIPGSYKLPSYLFEVKAVYTNKMPMAPYRAAGRPPGNFALEHALDLAARELKLDPATIRFRNFIQPDEFPYNVGVGDSGGKLTYDSGDYPECLRKALNLMDEKGFRREQAAAREEGRYLGLGIACYVESTGRGPFEGATVRVEPSGKVVLITGSGSQGQAHETTLAQVCADRLGVALEDITVIAGDTDAIAMGIGTFASRIAVVAGNAVSLAARDVQDRALRVAAELLEVSADDLEVRRGTISLRGVPSRKVSLAEVARTVTAPPPAFTFPAGLEPGLEATHYFRPTANTYASGAHIATVEVDVETGVVKVLRYAVIHDCGRVINPMVVDGQVHGGVGQGIGNALYEELVLGDDGQPLTTSYMEYLLPTAMEVPPIAVGHVETPSPLNPEGIKGAGEGGTIPVPSVIANAVEDALSHLGITVNRISLSPARLQALVQDAARAQPPASPRA